MVLFLGIGLSFVHLDVCPSGQHLDSHQEGASSQWSASILLGGAPLLTGSGPLGWGTALATVATLPTFQKMDLLFPWVFFWGTKLCLFCKGMVFILFLLLDMLVAKWEPTPCYRDAYSVGFPKGACGEKSGQMHYKTTNSPRGNCVFSG